MNENKENFNLDNIIQPKIISQRNRVSSKNFKIDSEATHEVINNIDNNKTQNKIINHSKKSINDNRKNNSKPKEYLATNYPVFF